ALYPRALTLSASSCTGNLLVRSVRLSDAAAAPGEHLALGPLRYRTLEVQKRSGRSDTTQTGRWDPLARTVTNGRGVGCRGRSLLRLPDILPGLEHWANRRQSG